MTEVDENGEKQGIKITVDSKYNPYENAEQYDVATNPHKSEGFHGYILCIPLFHRRHQALYGWGDPGLPAIIALLKLRAIARRRPLALSKQPFSKKDSAEAVKRKRQAYFKESDGFVETPCYAGDKMKPGYVISGPAIIEEAKTTVVVPPGSEVTVDTCENYLVKVS